MTNLFRVLGFVCHTSLWDAALFALFKGCADDAAIASVSAKFSFRPELIQTTTETIAPVDHPRKEDGAVVFLPIGPPHQMENLETTKPLRAIRLELKKAR